MLTFLSSRHACYMLIKDRKVLYFIYSLFLNCKESEQKENPSSITIKEMIDPREKKSDTLRCHY